MAHIYIRGRKAGGILAVLLVLASCAKGGSGGGGEAASGSGSAAGGSASSNQPLYLGISFSGLDSGSITVRLDTGEEVTLAAGGGSSARFNTVFMSGTNYNVSVKAQPTGPTLTCSLSGKSGSMSPGKSVSITCPRLQSVQVYASSTSVAPGAQRIYSLLGTYNNGQVINLSSYGSWSSNDNGVATVQSGVVQGVATGSSQVNASFAGLQASRAVMVPNITLSSLSISPGSLSTQAGVSSQLSATGLYSDGSTADLTGTVSWSTSDASVATVGDSSGSKGLVGGVASGSAIITADYSGVSAARTVNVGTATLTSLEVSPVFQSGGVGAVQQFEVTGVFSDGSTQDLTESASWSSSDVEVVNVSNDPGTRGFAQFVAAGSATVAAQVGSLSASASVSVSGATLTSLTLSATNVSVPAGFARRLAVTGSYSDGSSRDLSEEALWSSSDSTIFDVSNVSGERGRVEAMLAGSATLTASVGAVQASTSVTVSNATLSSLAADPAYILVPKQVGFNFRVTGTFSDASSLDLTDQVVWSSSDTSAISVSNAAGSEGQASNVYTGSATPTITVTATRGGVSGTANVIITPATMTSLITNPISQTVGTQQTQQYKAYGIYSDGGASELTRAVTWSSSDSAVASVSNGLSTRGQVTTLSEGSATVSATMNALSDSTSVTVSNSAGAESVSEGVGLLAYYHNNRTLSSLKGTRIDQQVNFNWSTGAAPLGVGDSFSIRWTGFVEAPCDGTYTFYTQSDDGVRLWVNNVTTNPADAVINQWTDHSSTEHTSSSNFNLTAGQKVPVKVEFYENGGFAVIQLKWAATCGGLTKQAIPRQYLYPE